MFSSSEQKAQVSFSLIACCLSVLLFVCKLFSRTSRQISTKFGKKHSLVKGIQMCSKKGPHPFPRGDNNKIAKIHCQNFNLLRVGQFQPKFAQSCYGWRGLKSLQMRTIQSSKRRQLWYNYYNSFAHVWLLIGTVSQVSDVAHGPHVFVW